jgi:hypothetical protein
LHRVPRVTCSPVLSSSDVESMVQGKGDAAIHNLAACVSLARLRDTVALAMKTIHYTEYMLDRMEFRHVPQRVVEGILLTAIERYFDIETGRFIAVQRVRYHGSYKRLAVAYEEKGGEITAVTVHTVTKRQIRARIQRQRWVTK